MGDARPLVQRPRIGAQDRNMWVAARILYPGHLRFPRQITHPHFVHVPVVSGADLVFRGRGFAIGCHFQQVIGSEMDFSYVARAPFGRIFG